MQNIAIEWTDKTWNPIRGCTAVSPGSENCDAQQMAHRFSAAGKAFEGLTRLTEHGPKWTGEMRVVPEMLEEPLHWRKPSLVFVNSMSDLFHKDVPAEYLAKIFDVMKEADQHQFQVLTKRPERLAEIDKMLGEWPEHVWMGVCVENAGHTDRIDLLRASGAKVKFLVLEPLRGPLPDLNLDGIDWVIVGGGTGPEATRMKVDWVRDVLEQCESEGVPFFFNQWGEFGEDGVKRPKKENGRKINGLSWSEMPTAAQINFDRFLSQEYEFIECEMSIEGIENEERCKDVVLDLLRLLNFSENGKLDPDSKDVEACLWMMIGHILGALVERTAYSDSDVRKLYRTVECLGDTLSSYCLRQLGVHGWPSQATTRKCC